MTAIKPRGIEINPGLRNSNHGFSRPTSDVSSPLRRSRFALAVATSFCAAAIPFAIFVLATSSGAPARSALSFASRAGAASTTFCAAAFTAFGYVMFGEARTRPIAVNVPTIMPSTMPPVLQRFQ